MKNGSASITATAMGFAANLAIFLNQGALAAEPIGPIVQAGRFECAGFSLAADRITFLNHYLDAMQQISVRETFSRDQYQVDYFVADKAVIINRPSGAKGCGPETYPCITVEKCKP